MKSVFKNHVIAHPETDNVITFFKKLNEEGEEVTYGKVRIDSVNLSMNKGFVSTQRRTAFVTLDSMALELLGGQIKAGKPYPMEGKIVVEESLSPMWVGHTPKINPLLEKQWR